MADSTALKPVRGGQFGPESTCQFPPESGGQLSPNFHMELKAKEKPSIPIVGPNKVPLVV